MSIKFVPPTEEELAARGLGSTEQAEKPAAVEPKPKKAPGKKKG